MAMVSSTAGAEPKPGSSPGQRIFGRQVVEQDGFLARVGSGLAVGLAFGFLVPRLVFGGRGAIVFCIPIIGLRLDFRLILHINARIVKRNLGQRNPV